MIKLIRKNLVLKDDKIKGTYNITGSQTDADDIYSKMIDSTSEELDIILKKINIDVSFIRSKIDLINL